MGGSPHRVQKMSSAQWNNSCSFFDSLLELISFLDTADADPLVTKGDTIDSVRSRGYFMIGKVLSYGVCTSMSLQGWDASERDPPNLSETCARPRPARVEVQTVVVPRTLPLLPLPWRRKALEQAHMAVMRLGPGRIVKKKR